MSDLDELVEDVESIDGKLNSATWHMIEDTEKNNVAIVFSDFHRPEPKMKEAAIKALEEL